MSFRDGEAVEEPFDRLRAGSAVAGGANTAGGKQVPLPLRGFGMTSLWGWRWFTWWLMA